MKQVKDELRFNELVIDIRDLTAKAKSPKDLQVVYEYLQTMDNLVRLNLKAISGGRYFEDYYFNLYQAVNSKLNKLVKEVII